MKERINRVLDKLTEDPELQEQIRSFIPKLKEETEDYYQYKRESDADRKRRSREQKKNTVKEVFHPIGKLSRNDKKQIEAFAKEIRCKIDTIKSLENNLNDLEKAAQVLIDECGEKYTKEDLTKKGKDLVRWVCVTAKYGINNTPYLLDQSTPFLEQAIKYLYRNVDRLSRSIEEMLLVFEEYEQKHGEVNRKEMAERLLSFTHQIRDAIYQQSSDTIYFAIESLKQSKPPLDQLKFMVYYDIQEMFYLLKDKTQKSDHYLCKYIAKLFNLSELKTLRGEEYKPDTIRYIIGKRLFRPEIIDAVLNIPDEFFAELRPTESHLTN